MSLSTLFGDGDLDAAEKRSLVFTDSVQDAAHRAGFVDHRSHAMSLRTALRRPLPHWATLPDWVTAAMRAAENDPFARYRLVPSALLHQPEFEPYWTAPTYAAVPTRTRTAVERRLLFDAMLEVGLQTTFGRTLEATGSVAVYVSAGRPHDLAAHGRAALGEVDVQTLDDGAAVDRAAGTWVRGVLEHMRRDGAIDHPWLTKYVEEDGNRHWIWGGRRRDQGAPAFPRGRSAPAFPVVGTKVDTNRSTFVPVTSPQSWYARWTAKCLGVSGAHGASLAAQLLRRLAEGGVLSARATAKGGTAYGIPAERVMVTRLEEAQLGDVRALLVCDTCRSPLPVAPGVTDDQLVGGPCHTLTCRGRMKEASHERHSFYRTMFATSDMRRVDAREHTSLLDAATRREIEAGFKRPEQRPGDPNVLVATPTLEMGIDIGDLSTVMLASLPDSVAAYQQRVGRGGRLTGSSLSLAYVTGRGENLPLLGEPRSMINGAVRPPATYLDAEEILQRQFLASVIDRMVREGYTNVPRDAGEALASADPGTLLGDVVERLRTDGDRLVTEFVAGFAETDSPGITALRDWVRGAGPTDENGIARSAEATIFRAVGDHTREVEELRRRRTEIENAIPGLREVAERPAATDDDKRALRSAFAGAALMRKVISNMTRGETWIGGLELRGLLPNYSLIDDSVQLDAQVSWIDPETQQFDSEPLIVDRGSSRALTELAPGAYFYAHRLEMRVDGVELGQDNADVLVHVACNVCGYVAQLSSPTDASPRRCPRCGGTGIAETGQRFEAARLVRVFSDVRRDDATIGDDTDDRRRTRFEVVTAVDFDPARLVDQWSVAATGLGVAHYRRVTVRWFNVGRQAPSSATMELAGREVTAQRFRICEACGKLDSGSGQNIKSEHRAWCRYRTSADEHTRLLALSRELVTQGVAINLPASVTDDMYSVPSLAAALQLGLREVMGGAPDHLRIEVVPHPASDDAGQVRQALFLHDTVPGGTGYLTELALPDRLWPILVRAAQVLEACPCAEEGRGSCHRCLAPFGRDVFRVDALRALRALLGVEDGRPAADLDPEVPEWQVVDTAPEYSSSDGGSILEQMFRTQLAERLRLHGSVKSAPTPGGTALTVTGIGARTWRLEPQVDLYGSRPDFVLSSPGTPPTAIFTDGRAYHASVHTNRLADDARKREILRANGYRVISVTYDDLESPSAPDWLNPIVVRLLMGQVADAPGAGISQSAVAEQEEGPLALLEGLVREPDSVPRQKLADALTLLLGAQGERSYRTTMPDGQQLMDVVCDEVRETQTWASGSTLLLHRLPHLVLGARISGPSAAEIVAVLDDRDDAVAEADFASSWREWLRWSNVLAMSTIPYTITTLTAVSTAAGPTAATAPDVDLAPGDAAALPGGWADVDLAYTDDIVRQLARLLAEAGVRPAEGGGALDTGSIAELLWADEKVAVVHTDMAPDEIADLRTAGWVVHIAEGDTATLARAVTSSLNHIEE